MERSGCGIGAFGAPELMVFLQQLGGSLCLMLLGVYLSGNFWSSVFPITQLLAGLQAVAILYIEIVSVSMGNALS